MPILQGFLFIAVGLLILSEESLFIKKLLHPLEQKYPAHFERIHAFRHKLFQKLRWLIPRKRSSEAERTELLPPLSDEV